MIELMVAILIGLFLMGGLLTMVQDNRRTFYNQNKLAQLQDSERLAMTMMNDVIQQSGYFPDPTTNTAASTLAAGTPSGATNAMAAGQAMTGTYSATGTGDTITVRYTTATGDGILNCSGTSNTSGANATYSNTFSVAVNAAGVSQLICTRETGTQYPLISGVTKLSVIYGVNTLGSGSNADTFVNASQVTNWNNVVSVRVTLTFNNPLYNSLNPVESEGQPATLTLSRNIGIMSLNGV